MTYQSNPAANEVSMAGAISLAEVIMYFSASAFLGKKSKRNVYTLKLNIYKCKIINAKLHYKSKGRFDTLHYLSLSIWWSLSFFIASITMFAWGSSCKKNTKIRHNSFHRYNSVAFYQYTHIWWDILVIIINPKGHTNEFLKSFLHPFTVSNGIIA